MGALSSKKRNCQTKECWFQVAAGKKVNLKPLRQNRRGLDFEKTIFS